MRREDIFLIAMICISTWWISVRLGNRTWQYWMGCWRRRVMVQEREGHVGDGSHNGEHGCCGPGLHSIDVYGDK